MRKRALEASLKESRALRLNFISPELILVALLVDRTCGAARVLRALNISVDLLRIAALQTIVQDTEEEGEAEGLDVILSDIKKAEEVIIRSTKPLYDPR